MPHAAPGPLRLVHFFCGFGFVGVQCMQVNVRSPNSGRPQKSPHHYNQTKTAHSPLAHLSFVSSDLRLSRCIRCTKLASLPVLTANFANFAILRDLAYLTQLKSFYSTKLCFLSNPLWNKYLSGNYFSSRASSNGYPVTEKIRHSSANLFLLLCLPYLGSVRSTFVLCSSLGTHSPLILDFFILAAVT